MITLILSDICGGVYQKQVLRAGTRDYIPQYLWKVITCTCPRYLLLAHTPSYSSSSSDFIDTLRSNLTYESYT